VAGEIEIRLLSQTDDRSLFSCGNSALDRFFQHYSGQNQFKLRIAVTYVACAARSIAGFATVTMATLERAELPDSKLRKRMPAYPLPVLRLARLAVDVRAQSAGIGAALLRHVLTLALEQRNCVGCIGVLADAKPEAVSYYQRYGFEPLHGVTEGLAHGDPQPMLLLAATIERALARDRT